MAKATLQFGRATSTEKKKLGELMLYIAQRSADDPAFGATKLNKILYFADFLNYQRYARPITGAQYMKLDHGPVPKHLIGVRESLCESGDAEEVQMMYHDRQQKRIVAKRQPNLKLFTAEDIAMLDYVIDALRNGNATNISRLSHNIIWRLATTKELIPYQAAYLSDDEPTPDDIQWAINEAAA